MYVYTFVTKYFEKFWSCGRRFGFAVRAVFAILDVLDKPIFTSESGLQTGLRFGIKSKIFINYKLNTWAGHFV